MTDEVPDNAIAIVGMACRFPGAPDVQAYWQNLVDGIESIRQFTRDELLSAGTPESLLADPAFVPCHAAIGDIDGFDADLFDYSTAEATMMDPQHRLLLECTQAAFDHAAFDFEKLGPSTAVYASCGMNAYMLKHVLAEIDHKDSGSVYEAMVGNEKDYLATRLAFKFDLGGPAATVQCACSSSLVGVHLACQSLLNGECDAAVAGAVSLHVPQITGYLWQDGGIASVDGHVRTFDARASGTVNGSGVGVLVMKRLADAIADRDMIHSVILATAINNDGALKASFMAPGVEGQMAVISETMAIAGVTAEDIGYIETHGTGTAMGDPIEVEALRQAFGNSKRECRIGSVKTNIGHLDVASGIAGIIKATLALKNQKIPPSLNYSEPNPKIDFDNTPFRVCTELEEWYEDVPRHAGVSSFGLGGTNGHIILREAPVPAPAACKTKPRLIPLSSQTTTAFEKMSKQLTDYACQTQNVDVADVAWSLATGRRTHQYAGFTVCRDMAELKTLPNFCTSKRSEHTPQIAFLYPGQGAQFVGAGRELYEQEPVFRQAMNECTEALCLAGAADVRELLFCDDSPQAQAELRKTENTQPVLFALGVALTELWRSHGIEPAAVLGHSAGEYAAAVCAGIMSLADAAKLITVRAKLMSDLPEGAMAAVGMGEDELRSILTDEVHIAAINAPDLCTISGDVQSVDKLVQSLQEANIFVKRLDTAHAFHSPAVETILQRFQRHVDETELQPPQIPFISAVLGRLIEGTDAIDSELWTSQIREPVRFAPAIGTLLEDCDAFLELGPGSTLAGLTARCAEAETLILAGLPDQDESAQVIENLGHLWLAGADINWESLFEEETPRRIPLPDYPFEHKRCWIETRTDAKIISDNDINVSIPMWVRTNPASEQKLLKRWLFFSSASELENKLITRLQKNGAEVTIVKPSDGIESDADYAELIKYSQPEGIIHGWSLTDNERQQGMFSLIRIARAMLETPPASINILTSGVANIRGHEQLIPKNALLIGPARVIPKEFPGTRCRCIDIKPNDKSEALLDTLITEIQNDKDDRLIALRFGQRWVQNMVASDFPVSGTMPIRADGIYLITGAFGGLGATIARRLAMTKGVTLAMLGRSASRDHELVTELQTAGASILVFAADISDRERMKAVCNEIYQTHGTITGVVHTAGIPGGGALAKRTDEEISAVLRPKIEGTDALLASLQLEKLEFIVFFSSTNALLSVPGQTDYCSANAYLDARAEELNQHGIPAVSINWGAWREVGMAVNADLPPAVRAAQDAELAQFGLSPSEACDTFLQILQTNVARVAVCRGRVLQEPQKEEQSEDMTLTSVGGSIRESMHAIWTELLGVAKIVDNDDFFHLGGHSLLAIRLTFRIKQICSCPIKIDELFANPTFGELLKLVEQRTSSLPETESESSESTITPDKQDVPLSFAQHRLWLLDRIENGSPRYNLINANHLHGMIDTKFLRKALEYMVKRHEILRTRLIMKDGDAIQIVDKDKSVHLSEETRYNLSPAEQEAAIKTAITEEAFFVFDLAELPLMRTRLISFGSDDHVIIWNHHHVITDAWSLRIFWRELNIVYTAYTEGREPELAELPIQYAEYAIRQQRQTAASLEAGIRFWQNELGDLPQLLELPTDYARPSTQSYKGDTVPIHFPAELVKRLRDQAKKSDSSLFMAVFAIICVCLSRHSGSKDIAIATPVANRTQTDEENLIGLFINTIVLRCRLDDSPTFRELLSHCRETAVKAYTHQNTPFEMLLDALKVRRDLSYSPLSQVMLSFLNLDSEDFSSTAAGINSVSLNIPQQHVLFDLDWQLRENENGITGHLIYACDIFSRERIETLVNHTTRIMEAFVENPDQSINEVDLFSPQEKIRIIFSWNNTSMDYERERCVHEIIAKQAEKSPKAIAVVCGDVSWNYRELNQRANRIAIELQQRNIQPGAAIGLCVERTPRMLAALLGIMKVGAAYVPLDPGFPAERLAYMLENSQATIAISELAVDVDLRNHLSQTSDILLLDELPDDGIASFEVKHTPSADDLMYIIYTSGSTGKPKGVMIPHRAVHNFLLSMANKPGLNSSDSLLAVTTLSFDIAGLELYLPLIKGARVVLADRIAAADPKQLIRLLDDEKITVMQATPATWRMMLAAQWSGKADLKILCGGEALPRDLSRRLLPRCKELWNMYGPTETTIWSAVRQINSVDESDGVESIGNPISNTSLYILDDSLQTVPIGTVGELYIGGEGLATGYHGMPELSAEKFVSDPFSNQADALMYRTGDRARYLPDGDIEFLGRVDHQVKLRGFRIELGEVESVLGRHPGISHCTVTIREDTPGDPKMVAYYCLISGKLTEAELRKYLRASVPEYMLPSIFVALPEMPLTPNGKVDRKRLPKPEPRRGQQSIEELDNQQRAVAAIWEKLLEIERPGLDDNLFDLGGHSLLIVHMHQALTHKFETDFDVLDLFRHPTIRSQAELVSGRNQLSKVREEAYDHANRQRQALARRRSMMKGKTK